MEAIFGLLFLMSLVAIPLGFIFPSIVLRFLSKENQTRRNVFIIYGASLLVFLTLTMLTTPKSTNQSNEYIPEKVNKNSKNLIDKVLSTPIPSPTPDLTPIKKEISDKFCSARKGEFVYDVFFCTCANLEDVNKYLESTGEMVTFRRAKAPPKQDICDKVAENCLKNWDREVCTKLADGKIWLGMTEGQLLISWGPANDKNNSVGSWGIHSQWVYGNFGPYVYLEGTSDDNMKVTSWQD